MVRGQPLLQRRWQQQLLLRVVGKEGLAHRQPLPLETRPIISATAHQQCFSDGLLGEASERIRGGGLHLKPLTWAMIGKPEPRVWLIDQWLPAGSVTLLTSRLALQLAAGIATNHPGNDSWIEGADAPKRGNSVSDGNTAVVYATWEDRPDEMTRRLSQISGTPAPWCEPLALHNLKILDLAGLGPLWTTAARYESPSLTQLGRALRLVVEEVDAGLLILDSLAAVYGANENDRARCGLHGVLGRLGKC